MALLAASAPEAVIAVLTEKWAGCILYLQILCLVGLMYPLQACNLSVIQAMGDSALFLKLEIVRKSSLVLMLLLTFQWGLLVMVWGLVVQALIAYVINTTGTRRELGYRWREQGRDLLPCFCCAAAAGGISWTIGLILHQTVWTVLAVKLAVGSFVYALLLLSGRRAMFAEEWSTLSGPARRVLKDLRRAVGLT
jgi:O-antigen/teichoic acid export membrane protein